MPLKLAIDATPLLGRPTGIGQYVRHLMEQLAIDPDFDLRPYVLSGRISAQLAQVLPVGVSAPKWPLPAAIATRAWEVSDHPRIGPWTGPVDVVHGTNFVAPPGAPAVVTVHDLTAVRYPEMCTPATLRYPSLIRRALARGALVQTPSRSVAEEVQEYFGIRSERVVPVHHGVPAMMKPTGEALGGGPFLLAVGTIEPRKDYPTLLRAFDLLADGLADLTLVVVGARGWGSDDFDATLSSMRHRDRVRVMGYVDERTRSTLLYSASAFAYPSIYEGFGLPPLEAMAAGVPVIATDTPVSREVLGGAAVLAPVGDSRCLAEKLDQVINNSALQHQLIANGRDQALKYNWSQCAEGLKSLYRQAANS